SSRSPPSQPVCTGNYSGSQCAPASPLPVPGGGSVRRMATARLSDLEDRAWRGFLYAHDRIWREIEAGIAPLGVSMTEYSVLALLGEAGPAGMRMSELAQRRLMSTGGFTRLADRLERRGLIE